MRVEIVVFDGVDELDAIGPFEVLQNAAAAGADFSVRLVSWTGAQEVVGSHGLRMSVETVDSAGERPDLVIVPGGGWIAQSATGARGEVQRGDIPRRLAEYHKQGTHVASVCTGAMLLAAAGLLRGRRAATHHGAIADLQAAGADVIDARVVDDGELVSCGGVTSGIDLALWLVERHASREIAARVEREMEYERRGEVWRRPG